MKNVYRNNSNIQNVIQKQFWRFQYYSSNHVEEEKEKERYFTEKEKIENKKSQRLDYSLHLYGRDCYNRIRNITMLTAGRDTQMHNQV